MNSTDILYLHPTKVLSGSEYSIMPVGIVAILNLLKERGYRVEGINIGIEKSLNPEYSLYDELKKNQYRVLLIDLHWYEHSYGAIEIAEMSKKIYPHVPVIIGGYTSTIYAGEILYAFECINFAVKGDSEEPMVRLTDYLIKGIGRLEDIPNICYRSEDGVNDKPITYTCKNIDKLDYVTCDFIKNQEYIYLTRIPGVRKNAIRMFWLGIARGCLYNCTYCCGSRKNSNKLFGRKNLIIRSYQTVACDIEQLYNKGVQCICPTHDFQMIGKIYYNNLFKAIREKNIKPGLYLESFQIPSKEFLISVSETFDLKHTRIVISALSGDEEVRKQNGKLFTNNEFFNFINYALSMQINLEIYYSINLAAEKNDTILKTIEQVRYIIKQYPNSPIRISLARVILDPLAPMREKKYEIKSTLNTFMDYYNYCKRGDAANIGYEDIHNFNIDYKLKILSGIKGDVINYNKTNNFGLPL